MDKIAGLQTLRAVAALMVLFGHVLAEVSHFSHQDPWLLSLPWTRGVDLFFVISGFVVTLSADRFARQPAAFLHRRLLRVVPLYFLFTTLMVAVLILLPTGVKETGLELRQIIGSYLFIPVERADGRIAPVLSLGWTLNYEVFFYALLAACLILRRPLMAVGTIILGLSALGAGVSFEAAPLVFWTNSLMVEFVFGIALARMWQSGWRWRNRWGAFWIGVLGGVLFVALHLTPLPRFVAAGIPASMIVAAFLITHSHGVNRQVYE